MFHKIGIGTNTLLWAEEDQKRVTLLAARAGEDHEKLVAVFRKDHPDIELVAVLEFHGEPPRDEYLKDTKPSTGTVLEFPVGDHMRKANVNALSRGGSNGEA